MEAIRAANEQMIRELLENQERNDDASSSLSVDVNQMYMGRTPVLHVVDRMIERSDENDPETREDVAALLSILKMLVDKGGRLPMDRVTATSLEDVPLLSRMFDCLRVAYATFGDSDPSSPSSRSVPSAFEEAIKLLVDVLNVPLEQDCCEHLHQASRRGDLRMMHFMVEKLHVDPNAPGRQGMTPLMVRTIFETDLRESERIERRSSYPLMFSFALNPAARGEIR
jgi:hypothetical protein